jgi:phosphoserine phosphatase
MKKLVCFDLDGTLTAQSTWELFNDCLGIREEDDQRLFGLYKEGNLDYAEWIAELVRLYNQNNKPVTKNAILAVADAIVLCPHAEEIVSDAKAKGYRIILIAGSIDIMAATLAKKVGIEEWYTTNKAVFNDNNELVGIAETGHERDAKLSLLQEYCLKNDYKLSEVIAVGDGGNDMEIFKAAKGVLIGNNKELTLLAWQHITDLLELNTIFCNEK